MKLWKAAAIGVAGLAGLVALDHYLGREREIKPLAHADANGDGIQDHLVFSRDVDARLPMLAYFDGNDVRKDQNGHYFARGMPTRIRGTEIRADAPGYVRAQLCIVGNFDKDPRGDISLSWAMENPQATIKQMFYNVLPAPKQ